MSKNRDCGKEEAPTPSCVHPEFKAEIVERCQAGDRSIRQVARDFDLVESAARRWVEQAELDAGRREGVTSDEREELSRWRRENTRL